MTVVKTHSMFPSVDVAYSYIEILKYYSDTRGDKIIVYAGRSTLWRENGSKGREKKRKRNEGMKE